jgi:predicted alpha/beta hydrolase family esterase
MRHTTLIVPGFHGSGPGHWQTWLERELPDARRVTGIDWETPVLARWAGEVRREIDAAPHAVWLVAHSFGCLASVVAAADRPDKVAGAVLVAPADPARFGPLGLASGNGAPMEDVGPWLPQSQLGFPCAVVASSDDPWVKLTVAAYWADRWGSRLIGIGPAGHINAESGFGPWPEGLEILTGMQRVHEDLPLGPIGGQRASYQGRHGALAKLRHRTRSTLDFQVGARPLV